MNDHDMDGWEYLWVDIAVLALTATVITGWLGVIVYNAVILGAAP